MDFKARLNAALCYPLEEEAPGLNPLKSVLKKLDANPGHLPYRSHWTGIDAIKKRFNLTPEEGAALQSCTQAYRREGTGGFVIGNLLLNGDSK